MLHVCSIFVCIVIKIQWLPLILNGKSTGKALVCLYEQISFICYLFDLGFVLKFCYLNYTKKCSAFCLSKNKRPFHL